MKIIITILTTAAFVLSLSGCSTQATVGNHDQHGAGISAKTRGMGKGVSAKVY